MHVSGDFARVSQILSNLINNAAKYTPKGGRISLSAAREGDEIVFRVRDSGVGIPPEFIAQHLRAVHAGRPYACAFARRARNRTHARAPTGGNAGRQRLGKERGPQSRQRVHGAPAGGGCERIRTWRPALRCGEPPSPAGLRVLVVDDNRDVADSTASVMRMNGCDVHVAYDGKAAIESVQRLRPDAVLLDIGLPTIDGYLVAEHIRAQPENGRTMIVAVSGYGQEQDRVRSKSVGFDYHVVKPIDPTVLAGSSAPCDCRATVLATKRPFRCRTRAPDGLTSGVWALPPRTVRYSAFAPATLGELAERAFARAAGGAAIEGNSVRLLCDARENFPAWREALSRGAAVHPVRAVHRRKRRHRTRVRGAAGRSRAGRRQGLRHRRLAGCWRALSLWRNVREAGADVRDLQSAAAIESARLAVARSSQDDRRRRRGRLRQRALRQRALARQSAAAPRAMARHRHRDSRPCRRGAQQAFAHVYAACGDPFDATILTAAGPHRAGGDDAAARDRRTSRTWPVRSGWTSSSRRLRAGSSG